MGRISSSTTHALRKKVEEAARCRRRSAASAAGLAAVAVTCYSNSAVNKTPMQTSLLTGEAKMQELVNGHPLTFYDMFGMSVHVFQELIHELQQFTPFMHSKHLTMVEQLGIFLYICRKGASIRDAMYMFQRSPDTVSKYICCISNKHWLTITSIRHFYRLLHFITSKPFYQRYVKLPPPDCTPPEIQSNPKLYPFFKDVLGAIDGTHISAFVADADLPRFRNRKGEVTQNVLVACTMDGRIAFVLSGWEGSATDARVLNDARKRGFVIPPGKKYLADAGYSLQETILPPYRNVRYHLREWGRVPERSDTYYYLLSAGSHLNILQATELQRVI